MLPSIRVIAYRNVRCRSPTGAIVCFVEAHYPGGKSEKRGAFFLFSKKSRIPGATTARPCSKTEEVWGGGGCDRTGGAATAHMTVLLNNLAATYSATFLSLSD